jgi:hypothetical protein
VSEASTSLALVLCASLALGSAHGFAAGLDFDPTIAQRFSVAPALVASTSSPVPLPRSPQPKWRVRVAGGILHPPSVTADGAVLLTLVTPTLVQYDASGRLQWSARLGASPAAHSAIVFGDGTRLVLTQAGEALAFTARGRLLRHTILPFANLDAATSVAHSDDGGLLIAAGRRVARLDAALRVVFSTRLEHEIRSVVAGASLLAVSTTGTVIELGVGAETLQRGSFAGRVDAVARVAPRRLLAVVDGRRLSELDLDSETLTTRFAEPDVELSPTLASNAAGEVRAVIAGEFLLALGRDGREKFRAALPSSRAGQSSAGGLGRPTSSDILLGPDGSTLVARAGLDIAAIQPDGAVARVEGSACAEPLRPAGMQQNSAVYACRSGILLRLDDTPPHRNVPVPAPVPLPEAGSSESTTPTQ